MITEEQRIARRGCIGGSDIAAILGLSKYKTPYQLYLDKKGLLQEQSEETQPQYWGNQLEPVIREEFSRRNFVSIETPMDTKVHPLYPFMRGNIDGWIPEWNSVLEIKTTSAFSKEIWDNGIPLEYVLQCAFYCSILNCDTCYVSVLIGGQEYREFKYTRVLQLENTIIEAACNFWDALQSDSIPDAKNVDDLKLMFPTHKQDKKKIVEPSLNFHLHSLSDIKKKIAALEAEEECHKFELVKYLEDSECLVDEKDQVLCTYRVNKKGSRIFLLKEEKNS